MLLLALALQPPAVPLEPAPPPGTASVGVVAHSNPAPTVAIGIDWTVLVPIIATAIGLLITTTVSALLSYHNGKKADAIHVLVNSGMSKALADNAAQAEEIRVLRTLTQSLNERISALPGGSSSMPTTHPTPADLAQAQAVVDAGRLPSAEVVAAQGSTPGGKPQG
jgi:hypothetical protein